MVMHQNSLTAYRCELDSLSARSRRIWEMLLDGVALTDRQVMRRLEFTDPNAVRPRITELIEEGWLREVGNVPDDITGKTVRLVKARTVDERREFLNNGLQQELAI